MITYRAAASAVPGEFRAGLQTQYGAVGLSWLDDLPDLLESVCQAWELVLVDVRPRNGFLSVVWQVRRADQSYALKLTVPSESFSLETAGLVAWDGRGMVRLVRHDAERGAALLQWLDPGVSLEDVPLEQAVPVAGELLTVTPEVDPATTSFSNARVEVARARAGWSRRNASLGLPLSAAILQSADAAAARIAGRPESKPPLLVNHDLHYANVIRDGNGHWVCIDPKPVIGPPEYALAPLIWRRFSNPESSLERVSLLCTIAGLDLEYSLDWLVIRIVDYALWALESGLTSDPAICLELLNRLT